MKEAAKTSKRAMIQFNEAQEYIMSHYNISMEYLKD
jgi:hypothetical protein